MDRCPLRSALIALLICSVTAGLTAAPAPANAEEKVLISYRKAPGAKERDRIRFEGGRLKYSYLTVPVVAATLSPEAIAKLKRDPTVLSVTEDMQVHATDLELDNTWGVAHIGSGVAHSYPVTGAGVKIAILDSGIDYTHPDLSLNYAGGYDFVNGDSDPMDDNGHGSHVAGTIAAVDNNFGVVGVAPDARLYALKVLDSQGSGYFSDIIAALEWCVVNGIEVTNHSYGSSGNPGSAVENAFIVASNAGILHVAAAGNSGSRYTFRDTVEYPAKYSSVIAVGATNMSNTRPTFSSTGPTLELAAPGVSVNSTILGGGYSSYSGTSMASPHVAGVAALLVEAGSTSGISASEIRSALILSAKDLGVSGRDNLYGYGLVDVLMALELIGYGSEPEPDPEPEPEPDPVLEPEPEPVVPVLSAASVQLMYSGGSRRFRGNLDIDVQVVNENGNPISNASVTVDIFRNGGKNSTKTDTTDSTGNADFRVSRAGSGEWHIVIKSITASGFEWDGVTPSNSITIK